MKHDGGWKPRGSRVLFASQWFGLRQDDVELPGGQSITYTFVQHPGYAMIVPLLDDGRVVMERVYRYTIQQTLLECPSGGLDGDEPAAAARRELEEETGWVAGAVELLGAFYGSKGISDERFHLFLGTDLHYSGRTALEATEQIEVELVPLERCVELALTGEISDAPSALGLLLAQQRLRAGRVR